VNDAGERHAVACGAEALNERGRRGAEHLEDALDRLHHAGDAAERQGRGHEPDHLAVRRRREAADHLDRIGRRVDAVVRPVEPLEGGAKSLGHPRHPPDRRRHVLARVAHRF